MTSSISHLRLRRWNTTLSKKKPKKNQAESNFFGGVFRKLPQKCWEVLGLLLRFHCGTITLAAVLIGFLRPLRFAVGTLTAVTRMPQNPFSWMEMLGLRSFVFFFFRGWFLSVLFLKFLLKTRDPGFSRFFHRLGMKTLIFRLGMPPEWRHGDDSNTWEFWDITQGDLKHCLQYAGQSHCLGSRHVIIRKSGFYARNPLGTIPKHQLNRCGFVGDENMLGCFGWWICVSPPPNQPQCFFFPFAKRSCLRPDCNRGCLVVPASWAAIPCFWISFQPMLLLIWFYTHHLSGRPWTMRIWSWRSVRRQPIHWSLDWLMNIHWKTEIFNDMIFVSTSHL